MSFGKHAVFGFALLCSLASPAFAQGIPQVLTDLKEGTVLMVSPTGKVTIMQPNNKEAADMMMKEATKMTTGMMIMMHGGQMYSVHDKKMPNGKMMSDMMMHQ